MWRQINCEECMLPQFGMSGSRKRRVTASPAWQEALSTARPPHPLLDAIAVERAPPCRDNTTIAIQEARRPSTKLETDKVSSAHRDAAYRPGETTGRSADIISRTTRFERRGLRQ